MIHLDPARIQTQAHQLDDVPPLHDDQARSIIALLAAPTPDRLVLTTASYRSHRPEYGAAIRTSHGHPRWSLPYRLTLASDVLTPPWAWVSGDLSDDEFTARYRDRLDDLGVDGVTNHLLDLSDRAGTRRLALLCFENLTETGVSCHRSVFAAWWRGNTSQPVTEQP